MCMIEDADGSVTNLTTKLRTARKTHKCTECRRVIEVGETYLYETMLWDGRIDRSKTCEHCQVVRDWLQGECGGWVYGGVEEDIVEHAHEGYGFGVVRLAVGMRRCWQRYKGGMMPVPRMPKTTHEVMAARGK